MSFMAALPSLGSIAGGVLGIGQGIFGSQANKQASQQMSQGNLLAAMMQQQMYQQQMQNLQPFMQYGQTALNTLSPLIGLGGNPLTAELTSRFAPTIERLMQTPGYQFTLDQGLRNVQNSFAARGLGSSSNALRGAADYATGLASTTFNDQFKNYWNENQSIYNMLAGAGSTGLQAAGMGAQMAPQFAQGIGNALQGYGNAQGQGTLGANQALFGGLGSAYGMLNYGPSMGSSMSNFFGFNP